MQRFNTIGHQSWPRPAGCPVQEYSLGQCCTNASGDATCSLLIANKTWYKSYYESFQPKLKNFSP